MISRSLLASLRRLAMLLFLLLALLVPSVGLAQDDAEEEPEVQKEWVVGYALAFLPMAGAMYFMFRAHKRHEYKPKKDDSDEMPKGH